MVRCQDDFRLFVPIIFVGKKNSPGAYPPSGFNITDFVTNDERAFYIDTKLTNRLLYHSRIRFTTITILPVFLDRDGTIIEDVGYPHEISQIKFLPKVSEAIKLLNENAFKVIVVTNQAGVARGYFTEETVKEINRYIQESLAKQGAFLDNFYYCPHPIT